MHIAGVILNNPTSSVCISTEIYSYSEFISESANYSQVALVVQLDNNSFLYIDIRKLIDEQPLSYVVDNVEITVSDWNTLNTYLNNLDETILKNYLTCSLIPRLMKVKENEWIPCPFYSNIETQLRIVGAETTQGINIELGNHEDPYSRTKSIESQLTPDVVIVNTGRTDIDFDNSIPIINGGAFYPEVWVNPETGNTELFALQAGKWIAHSNWNNNKVKTTHHNRIPNGLRYDTLTDIYVGKDNPTGKPQHYNKGTMIVDFSSIGSIDIYKLSDCRDGVIVGETTVSDEFAKTDVRTDPNKAWRKGIVTRYQSSYYTINFALPKDATIGIPILCIGGRLFFTTDNNRLSIRADGDYTWVALKIERHVLNNIIMSNHQWYGKQIPGTSLVEVDPKATLDELFQDTPYGNGSPTDMYRHLNEDLSTPFVIILHANKKVVATKTEPKMKIGPDKLLFPPDAGGLLYNRKTHEIVDYTRIPYASGTLITYNMQRPLSAIDNCDPHRLTKPQLGFEWNDYIGREKYVKFNICDELRDLNEFILLDFAYMEV